MDSIVYKITRPNVEQVPILISSPHSGIQFPEEVISQIDPKFVKHPEDADWFIDRLYDFTPDMGITLISAQFSRYVIDLNRDPESKALYDDGRIETSLVPLTTFNGEPLYTKQKPDGKEIERRYKKYYLPYHKSIGAELNSIKDKFGHALLFDAHSIKQVVKSIRDEAFPDLILGNQDKNTADPNLIEIAYSSLNDNEQNYSVSHNDPFKGGYITRSFADPKNGIHCLQLEMVQKNYMDEAVDKYNEVLANKMRGVLKNLFLNLIEQMAKL